MTIKYLNSNEFTTIESQESECFHINVQTRACAFELL